MEQHSVQIEEYIYFSNQLKGKEKKNIIPLCVSVCVWVFYSMKIPYFFSASHNSVSNTLFGCFRFFSFLLVPFQFQFNDEIEE